MMKKNLLLSAFAIVLLCSFTSNKKHTDKQNKEKETIKVNPIQGDFVSISGPDVLNPNSMVQIVVEYTASSNRDIVVFLQNTKNYDAPWVLEGRKSVNAGSGTAMIEFKVPRLPNVVNGYRWGTFVAEPGGGYSKKVSDESFVFDVDILRIKNKKKKKD